MMLKLICVTGVVLISASAAAAQENWSDVVREPLERPLLGCDAGPFGTCHYGEATPTDDLSGDEFVQINCAPNRADCGSRYTHGLVRLDEFARADTVAALSSSLADMNAQLSSMSESQSQGIALAGVVDFQGPAEGASNRVGATVNAFDGEAALGLSYSAQRGAYDFALGVGLTERETIGKASFGYSW